MLRTGSQVFLCAVLCTVSVGEARAQLRHLWTFDSDFMDSVGSAHGTAIAGSGEVSITSVTNDDIDEAEFLVGDGGLKIVHGGGDADYVDIPIPVFPETNPAAFSLNLFYRFDVPPGGADDSRNFLLETSPGFSVGLGQGAGDDMEWFFQGGPSDTSGPSTNDDVWHQATLIYDNLTTMTASFYHDGILRDQVPLSTSFDQASQADGLHIGTYRNADDRNWSGFIDEVAIYDNALTAIEVADLYRGAFGMDPPLPADPTEALVAALELTLPVGPADTTISRVGWEALSFTPVDGPLNDLGDAGFSGGSYAASVAQGEQSITIELRNLPSHSDVSLGGLLAQLDSLDPARDGDRFRILLDGAEIFNEGFGFGDSDDGVFSEPPYEDPDNAVVVDGADLFDSGNFNERVYSLFAINDLRNIPHTSDTLTLEIIGGHNQAFPNEGYGLDLLGIVLDAIVGDATGDGAVDEFDFFLISDNLGERASALGADGDVNLNGTVDLADFRLWKDNATTASLIKLGFAIPEPSAALLTACSVLGLMARWGARR